MWQRWVHQGYVVKAPVAEPVARLIEFVPHADRAAQVLLRLGGSAIEVRRRNKESASEDIRTLSEIIGREQFEFFCYINKGLRYIVPLGNEYLIRYYRALGYSYRKISRAVRVTEGGAYKRVADNHIVRTIPFDRNRRSISPDQILEFEEGDFVYRDEYARFRGGK